MKKLLFLALVALLPLTMFSSEKQIKSLPDITLKDIYGNNVNLKEYHNSGKIIIVSFWATWCGPCIKELSNIHDNWEEWEKKYNAKLVAVSIDDPKNALKVKPFVDGKGWNYDVLLDVNQDLRRTMNVTNPPFTFVYDRKGNLVFEHISYVEGDEYILEKELDKILKAEQAAPADSAAVVTPH